MNHRILCKSGPRLTVVELAVDGGSGSMLLTFLLTYSNNNCGTWAYRACLCFLPFLFLSFCCDNSIVLDFCIEHACALVVVYTCFYFYCTLCTNNINDSSRYAHRLDYSEHMTCELQSRLQFLKRVGLTYKLGKHIQPDFRNVLTCLPRTIGSKTFTTRYANSLSTSSTRNVGKGWKKRCWKRKRAIVNA